MAPLLTSLRSWPPRWAAHMPPVMVCTSPPLGHPPPGRSSEAWPRPRGLPWHGRRCGEAGRCCH
eukprot:6536884-Pyramimonas_sp.AAC.1